MHKGYVGTHLLPSSVQWLTPLETRHQELMPVLTGRTEQDRTAQHKTTGAEGRRFSPLPCGPDTHRQTDA